VVRCLEGFFALAVVWVKQSGAEMGGVLAGGCMACSVVPVVTIGRGNSEIPFSKDRRLAGRRFQRSRHSAKASFRAVLRSKAFDGGGSGRVGARRAASAAMALRCRRGVLTVGCR
jgi:hypothetical protein